MVPVYVVSLADSIDRRSRIGSELSELSIPYEFIDAVDGRRQSPEELSLVYDQNRAVALNGRPLSKGEVGCALSHQEIYKKIIADGTSCAVVLEDDAQLTLHFKEIYDEIDKEGPDDFDVISLHARSGWLSSKDTVPIGGSTAFRVVSHSIHHTVAYVISASGAAKLRRPGRVDFLADWPLPCKQIRFYAVVPEVVGHPLEGSTLEEERSAISSTDADGSSAGIGYWGVLLRISGIYYIFRRANYRGFRDYVSKEGIQPWSRLNLFKSSYFYLD